jgi:anti-anti-sigma factor
MVEFNFDKKANTLVCALNGRMGTDINEEFTARLTGKIGECRNSLEDPEQLKVCLDLKNVNFIASSFIRTCVTVSRQVSAGNFSIINATPIIKKTFKIAGLGDLLNVR